MPNHYFTVDAANNSYETILIPCRQTTLGWQYKIVVDGYFTYTDVPKSLKIHHVTNEEEQLLIKLRGVEAVKSGVTVLGIETDTWENLESLELVKR
jgi:hypothetical protein